MANHPNRNKRAKYVIINDYDAPEPNMICQWVPGKGYCYLDRCKPKPRHDGMSGNAATSLSAFGFKWSEGDGGIVSFYLADDPPLPVTATYHDGEPRRWQSALTYFEHRMLATIVAPERV